MPRRVRRSLKAVAVVAKPAEAAEASERNLGPTVRELRTHAGWSLAKLAEAAEVSAASIFKIEKGTMVPTISVLLRIARALNRSVEELLAPAPEALVAVFRKDQRQTIRFAEIPIAIERLVAKLPGRQLECGIYIAETGASSAVEPMIHAGEKLYFLLEGRVRFELDHKPVQLEPGDAIHLKGSVPHRWENLSPGPSRILFVVTPPPLAPVKNPKGDPS